ncbi:death-associated inhibitor of apoptosis 1-like [Daktulosphaira vitifoliae]|uniref:death-associated inhibitor of apoptosis 1-like n=1 Tax=Daktulosphaira vitifoliae TaxID=58002 RepID=UPI0021A97B81|nr:death-associated inhibitor of apoptosis 1-like [Daktulosphaira vitifoliae]
MCIRLKMDSGNETYKAYENSGYDVCGFYCSTSNDQQPRIKLSKHKEFADYNTRLKTFENCPKKLESKISTLCDAGFLYIGNGQNDQMLCYCCSQGLKDWDDEDDPWVEHVRWSPSCTHILLCKGQLFIQNNKITK